MNKDRRDLVNRLFVMATQILEDSHISACDGQSRKLSVKSYGQRARRLSQTAEDLANIATTIRVALSP